MDCNLLTKTCLFLAYTIVHCVIAIYSGFHWLLTVVIYCFWLPFWCSWMVKIDDSRSTSNRTIDSPLISENPDWVEEREEEKVQTQNMANKALELEYYLEGSTLDSSLSIPLHSITDDPELQRQLRTLSTGCEVTFDIELTLNVETTICETPNAGGCVVEDVDGSGGKTPEESGREKSSKEVDDDENLKFSLDMVPLEFLYMTWL